MVAQNNIFKAPVLPQNPAAAEINNGVEPPEKPGGMWYLEKQVYSTQYILK